MYREFRVIVDMSEMKTAILTKKRDRNVCLAKYSYLRHKVGVNRTRMVNTSSLPNSIAAEHTQV